MTEKKSIHNSMKKNPILNWFVLSFFIVPFSLFSQLQDSTQTDTLQYERFIETVENSVFEYYKETWSKEKAYQVIDSLGYEDQERPIVSDSIIVLHYSCVCVITVQ
jgi:membrane-bound lytic murein transglycosylase D